jgi:hypothetical protein
VKLVVQQWANANMQHEAEIQGMVTAALEIAARRKAVLASMRKALESGNESQALQFARQLCGLESNHETSNRANPSIN